MPQSVLELAKELTLALIEAGNVPPEDMHDTLQKTHTTLLTLKAQEAAGTTTVPVSETPPARVDWRKSITKRSISCLECGKTFKQLSTRHLREHAMDARGYRAKYGIPRTQALAARETTARRRRIVEATRPWEKTPRFREARERAEAEALRDEVEEPTAAAPVPAKRERKATPKKTARKKGSEGQFDTT